MIPEKTNDQPKRLMTISMVAAKTGLTEAALRTMIRSGNLRKDKHYYQKIKGGRIMMDYDAIMAEMCELL